MPFAIGVKFDKKSFSQYYNPNGFQIETDDFCVVQDKDSGKERVGYASILEGRAPIQMHHLPKVIRLATESEIEAWYDQSISEKEMTEIVRQRAEAHKLSIKISEVNLSEDKRQLLIRFTADNRVDFRQLVKDLASRFRVRIEMWQIGSREEARARNGVGVCGQELCCSKWIKDFPTVAMRHAKDQDISQPPSKLMGACGRLRCCLRYEHETYTEMSEGMPAVGCKGCCKTSGAGSCCVVDRNILKQELTVRGSEGGALETVAVSEFKADA